MPTTSQRTKAPDAKRMVVNVAASIGVCFKAIRQSSEFPAKAVIAISVMKPILRDDMERII